MSAEELLEYISETLTESLFIPYVTDIKLLVGAMEIKITNPQTMVSLSQYIRYTELYYANENIILKTLKETTNTMDTLEFDEDRIKITTTGNLRPKITLLTEN